MEYRQLPHGEVHEKFGVLGLGMGGIQHTPQEEIEAIIRKAIDNGINFFDLCAGSAVYEPFGRAIQKTFQWEFLNHYQCLQDAIAADHYTKLSVKADACLQCGHCESRCPFGVKQMSRMEVIDRCFREVQK